MASYTSTKASSSVKSNASAETFTFDISSAITAANIPAYSTITKVTITVWGDIDTASNRGKMTASFGSTSICSDVYAGGSAGEVSRSADLPISTYFNSGNANAGKLKDSSTRLTIVLDGPIMLSKFTHTASWQIYIEWTPATYTIKTASSPSAAGITTGDGVYYKGDTVTITAEPVSGIYTFKYWQDDTSNTNPVRTITVNGDATYTAVFEILKSQVTLKAAYGTITGATNGAYYDYGTVLTLTAIPNEGYRFTRWQDGETDNPRTVKIIQDITFIAAFEKITYTATFKNGDGSTLETVTVAHGDTPVCSKTPTKASTAEYTYTFSGWSPALGAVTGNQTYTPNFTATKRSYTISTAVSPADSGTISGGGTYEYGKSVTLTATANTGYKFVQWNDGNKNASRTITVSGAATYTATFEKLTYTVSTASSPTNGGTVSGGGTYEYGKEVTLTATPSTSAGYEFVKWSDGVTSASRKITVTGNATYTAEFRLKTYTVTFKAEDSTTLKTESVTHGLKATPPTAPEKADTAEWDYTFDGWYDSNGNKWTSSTTITGNITYTAQYTATKRTYSVTVILFNGQATRDYEYGTRLTIVAQEVEGYDFIGWSDGNTEKSRVVTVTGNATYQALYEQLTQVYSAKSLTQPFSGNIKIDVYVGNTKI